MSETVGIIGAGRFGRFWGRALNRVYPVSLYDTDPACRSHIGESGVWADLDTCMQQSFVFLTIPISGIPDFLKAHARRLRSGSVILDCASVKLRVAEWFSEYLPDDVFYALSHPLFGPDSARTGLQGHRITLMPGRIPLERYQHLVRLFGNMLSLQVINLSPEEHDRLMAYNLSLIHLLGRTGHKIELERLPLMMDSMKKLNSISKVVMNDSEQLFRDFFRFNPYAREVSRNFLDSYSEILRSVSGDAG